MTVPITSVDWDWCHFDELSGATVHAMLQLRQQVFVLEQTCLYPDIDALDLSAHHLLGWQMENGQRKLCAYLRCMAPDLDSPEIVIGRVLVSVSARNGGIGRQLMQEGMHRAYRLYPGHRIRISAQAHLETFYASLGFIKTSDVYLEDGIPHITMLTS